MITVPHIPIPDRDYALSRGVATEALSGLWERHCRGSSERGYPTYGGTPWRRYVDVYVARSYEDRIIAEKLDPDAVALERKREAERRARDLAEREYARRAVNLLGYLELLEAKPPGELTEVERRLLAAPRRGNDLAEWLMAAVVAR